jgi:leucyl-tRNA synthetase
MAFYLLIHHLREHNIESTQLDEGFYDYVLLGQGDKEAVSKQTKISVDLLTTLREEFEYWYPNDQRHTGVGHIPNHLSFFIFHHAAIFPERHWPQAITINEFVIRDGVKMSKSKGNFIPMADIPRRYGADLYRLYISQIGDLQSLVDWQEKDVTTIRRRLNRLIRLWEQAAKLPEQSVDTNSFGMVSRWILSKMNTTIREATKALNNFRFRTYVLLSFYQLLTDVEIYLRRIPKNHSERGPVLHYILTRWVRLLAPVMPHLCEEIWERMGNISFASLEVWPVPEEAVIDTKIEKSMEVVEQTIVDIKEISGLLKGKNINTAHIYVSPEWKYAAFQKMVDAGAAPTVKELMPLLMKNAKFKKRGKEVTDFVQAIVKAGGFWTFVDKQAELKALQENQGFIQAETGLTITIQDGDKPTNDPDNRAPKALPGRPALFLE